MQPWAWLIVNGHKNIENRAWQPQNPGLRFRGPVLIHAGKRMDPNFKDAQDWMWPDIERPCDFDLGGIVGEAEIIDVVTDSLSEWFHGPYGLVIGKARPLPFRPCRGMLGFFTPEFSPPAPPRPEEGGAAAASGLTALGPRLATPVETGNSAEAAKR
jgi:hypothetical protein